ncbi:hypothetical protein EFY87_04730 [Flexivirga caeni]|uniref:Uncharacterized protein n=1 Tax=Flexivirga caeni TaxID=2294115 RepID=A0A3M9MHY9_9MICO|nr:hypothetical protein EFY87_04730 [Flexivirga caeni]
MVVHRPVLGEVEGRVVYPVACTGNTGYEDRAPLGSIAMTQSERFTLSLGVRETYPSSESRSSAVLGKTSGC